MNISFQGFHPGLPLGWYILVLIFALTLSWWSYRHFESISAFARYSLIGLRGLVFFILLALLLNPLFESRTTLQMKPEIPVFLDNSRSTTVEKGRYQGKETYRNLLNNLDLDSRPEASFSYFSIGEQLAPAKPDTLQFNASKTNLYNLLDHLQMNAEDHEAAVVISDGIYTAGQDPSYLAQQINTPVYVIGIGDTVRVNDLVIKNIITNNQGYTRTEHSVETTVINEGFEGKQATVQLLSSGQIMASRTISFEEKKSAHTVNFTIPLQEEGLHQYRIHIPKLEGEWTDANNEKAFSIDVKSNRDRILHASFEVHPDVKTVRSILATDKNISLLSRTWVGNDRFLEGDLPENTDTLDLVILHGYPPKNRSSQLESSIQALTENLPVMIIRTPGQDLSRLPSSLQSILPVSVKNRSKPQKVSIFPVQSQTGHPVMELPEMSYSGLSAIHAPIRNIQLAPGGSALFNVLYRGTETDLPFIALQQIGNRRSTFINGYGFYKWAQSYEQPPRSFITRLIHNLVTWSAADTEKQLLKVEPAQKVFDGDERVRISAFLRNESGNRESDGSVDLTLSGENMTQKQYAMDNDGNGKYSLDLGTLAEGIYQFKATGTKGERTIDTYQGEFSVSSTNIEYVNTTRNDPWLRQLANSSGGRFYDFSNSDSLWDHMQNAGLLDKARKTESNKYYPYQHSLWFVVVILLLGMEWLLRKYFALP